MTGRSVYYRLAEPGPGVRRRLRRRRPFVGNQRYRDYLRLLYLPTIDSTGALAGLRMVPMRSQRMPLRHASREDAEWLRETLDSVSSRFGVHIDSAADGSLTLRRE